MKKIIFYLFSILFQISHSFLFDINDHYPSYCFKKQIAVGDKISLSFVVSAEQKELVTAELKYNDKNTTIYKVVNAELGNYKSEKPLENGIYELCFYCQKGKKFQISMNFYTLYEDQNVKDLATDKEVKKISTEIEDIKNAFQKIESNARHLINRRYGHLYILKDIISSIKRLTFLKIVAVAILSAFQIYIIQKFFGTEKRVSHVKGAFADKGNIL